MTTSVLKATLICSIVVFASAYNTHAQTNSRAAPRPVQVDGKWGYIDSAGKIVIKPQFFGVEEFSEGLAAFEIENGKHGYIDETGKIVVEPKFDSHTDFSEGLAAVSIDLGWGFIDKTGAWAIPPRFANARPFSDGLALVGVPLDGKVSFPPGDVKHVFIDKTGKIAIAPKDDVLNGTFSAGVGTVQFINNTGDKPVLLDKQGKVIAGFEQIYTEGFSDGLAPAKKNDKWGYIDTSGHFAIEPKFEEAHRFSEGLAAVLIDEKWGFIDRTGRIAIPAKYGIGVDSNQHDFSEGLALVYFQNKCVYLDKTGKALIKVACSDAEQFRSGIASVQIGEKQNEQRGYINQQGKFIWGPSTFKYESMEELRARWQKDETEEEKEVLTPLTEEEKALNARDLILNQPDFVADLNFFVSEGFGGYGGAQRLARKGKRYRAESPTWLFIGELGKPSAQVFPKQKTYDAFDSDRGGSADSTPLNPQALSLEPGVTFTALGSIEIDGHHCIKIEAARPGKPEKFDFYAARDLKNLVIVAQVIESRRSMVQRLGNISLEVPDSVVEIPADYKPVEHDRWTRVENAKVTEKGRVYKDAAVFRAPGGQLFIRVNDWTYLVRPQEAKVEGVFQGLLVATSGEYVWLTKENEAYSLTNYRIAAPPSKWDHEEDMRVIVKPKSVTFRSNNYSKNKAMIEVIW